MNLKRDHRQDINRIKIKQLFLLYNTIFIRHFKHKVIFFTRKYKILLANGNCNVFETTGK